MSTATPSFNAPAATDPSTPATVAASTPATPAVQPQVIEYNGKQLSPQEVITKITNQDAFIETLKQERVADRAKMDELIAAVSRQALTATPAAPTPATAPAPQDFGAEVDRVLTAREVRAREEANWAAAQTAMTQAFGAEADAKARALASSIGYSFEELVGLARTKPDAFKRLFPELSVAPSASSQATPTRGVVNTQSQRELPNESGKKFWGGSHRDSVAAYTERLNKLPQG